MVHLAAGIPGKNNDGLSCVVVNIPAEFCTKEKKEDLETFFKEACGEVKSVWTVKSKKGPMKEHPFCFVNFETAEAQEKCLLLTQVKDQDVEVLRRRPSIWVGGFADDTAQADIETAVRDAGVDFASCLKPEGKRWVYLGFATSEAALTAADELEGKKVLEFDVLTSFPRNAKEKDAMRNRVVKSDDLDANKKKVFCYKAKDVTTETITEHLSKFGEVEISRKSDKAGFAFGTYKKYLEAYKASSSETGGDWEVQISSPDYRKKIQKGKGRGRGGKGRGGKRGGRGGKKKGRGGRRGRSNWNAPTPWGRPAPGGWGPPPPPQYAPARGRQWF